MSKKTKQILAIVALVFMGLFSVTFIVWVSAQKALDGRFAYIPLTSAVVGIGLFFVVKFIKTPEEKAEALKKAEYLSDAAQENLNGEAADVQNESDMTDKAADENQGNVNPAQKTDGKKEKDATSASKTATKK